MKIGEKIRQERKRNRLTQEELAAQMGVSIKTLQRWETEERSPRTKELKKLSEILGTSVEYLMGEAVEKEDTNEETISEYTKEQVNNKQGMATMSLGNGRNLAAPATPEGYAFLERMFAIAMAANGEKVHA